MCVGTMTSARSTLTLVGLTIIGKASDSKSLDKKLGGTRWAFLVFGVVAAARLMIIATQADSISALWVSMIPSALFQQNFNVLKALFGEYHDTQETAAERAGKVGKLGMAAGLAFMVGPLLGSMLFETYQQAAIFALICLAAALDDRANTAKPTDKTTKKALSFLERFVPDVPAARTPLAIFIMVSRTCMALSFHSFQTIFQVALQERFNFGTKDYG
jgi:hypothetical protein